MMLQIYKRSFQGKRIRWRDSRLYGQQVVVRPQQGCEPHGRLEPQQILSSEIIFRHLSRSATRLRIIRTGSTVAPMAARLQVHR